MFKKVAKTVFMIGCISIGALSGYSSGNEILESIAALSKINRKEPEDTAVETAEEET